MLTRSHDGEHDHQRPRLHDGLQPEHEAAGKERHKAGADRAIHGQSERLGPDGAAAAASWLLRVCRPR